MKLSRHILTFLTIFTLMVASSSHAQFGKLPSLKNPLKKDKSAEEVAESYKQLTARFASSSSSMLIAQAHTLDALGFKNDADKLRSEAGSVNEGECAANCMNRMVSVSANASEKTEEALKNADTFSGDSKKTAKKAVTHYALGTLEGATLPKAFSDWVNSAGIVKSEISANPLKASKYGYLLKEISGISEVAKNLPALVKDWSSVTNAFIKLSKKSGIDTNELQETGQNAFD